MSPVCERGHEYPGDYCRACDAADAREEEAFAAEIARTNQERSPARPEPPPGSYAETARAMAELFPDFDWDAWKDEMKDGGDR